MRADATPALRVYPMAQAEFMTETPRAMGGLGRSIAAVTAVTVATKVAAAVAGVLTARILGPTAKGTLALSLLFVSVMAALGFLGLDVWLLAEASPARQPNRAAQVLRRHAARTLPAAVAASVVLGASGVRIGWLTPQAAAAAAAAVAGTVLFFPVASLLLAIGARRRFATMMLVDCIGFLGLLVGLWLAIRPSVAAVIALFAAARLVAVSIGILSWLRLRRLFPEVTLSRHELRDAHRAALTFGIPTFVGYLLTLATYRVDTVLLGGMRSAYDVGLYTAAAAMVEFMWVIPDATGQILVTQVAADPAPQVTAKLTRTTVAIMVLTALAFTILASPLVQLIYGDEYARAANLVPPLAVAGLALGLWKVLVGDLAGRGFVRPRARTALIAVAGMLSADLALIPAYGSMGAALGSVFGYALAAAVIARQWILITGGSGKDLLLVRRGDIADLVRRTRHPPRS